MGNNIDWIQGAGGNTSVKENSILWVKASGYWLSDAQNINIFTPLDRQVVIDKIDQEVEDLSSAQILDKRDKVLKPSIETTLHALMRQKFVAHLHSVNVISYAVLKNGEKILNELKVISKSKGWNLVRWITRDDNLRAKSLYDRVAEKTNWDVYELK